MANDVEQTFISLFFICLFSLLKYLFMTFAHFVMGLFMCLLLSFFEKFLYNLDICPLSDKWSSNIFSKPVFYLLISLRMFPKQKFLILIKFNSSTFSSVGHAFSIMSKNSSPHPRSQQSFFMISSKRLLILCFTFKYMIYFELNFVESVKLGFRFICLST